MKIFDLETEDGDLVFFNGDLQIFESNKESAHAILDSTLGQWRNSPTLDVNLKKNKNGTETVTVELENSIRGQMSNDGYNVTDLSFSYDLKKEKLTIITKADRNF